MSNGGNATEAAKAVGYSEKRAGMQVYRMCKEPYILSISDAACALRISLRTCQR